MWRLRLRRRRSGQTDAPISDPSAVLASRAYVTLKVSTPPAGRGAQHVFEAHLRQPCAAAPHNSGHDVAWSRDQEAWLAQRSDRSTAEVGGSSPPRPTISFEGEMMVTARGRALDHEEIGHFSSGGSGSEWKRTTFHAPLSRRKATVVGAETCWAFPSNV